MFISISFTFNKWHSRALGLPGQERERETETERERQRQRERGREKERKRNTWVDRIPTKSNEAKRMEKQEMKRDRRQN